MHYHISHRLLYTYDRPVSLSPHRIYLTPRALLHQEVHAVSLTLQPGPSYRVQNIDAEGNGQHIAFWTETCEVLEIRADFHIESGLVDPFHFVYYPFEAKDLPFQYPEQEKTLLGLYLPTPEQLPTSLHLLARELAARVQWVTADFLLEVVRYVHTQFTYERREEGPARAAEVTLWQNKGTCRDFAVLMIGLCQALGIAARFVSGYCFGSPRQAYELHAWVEVYLPGGGWRGFDPTEGKAVDHTYVVLASSARPDLISPVTGTFRSSEPVTHQLLTTIMMTQA